MKGKSEGLKKKKRRYNIGRDTEERRRVEKDGCNTCTESGVGG